MPLPARIANAPRLTQGLEMYYGAFLDLDTTRGAGFSEGPIPWTAVEEYAKVMGYSDMQKRDLHHHIRKMDVVVMNHRAKVRENSRD